MIGRRALDHPCLAPCTWMLARATEAATEHQVGPSAPVHPADAAIVDGSGVGSAADLACTADADCGSNFLARAAVKGPHPLSQDLHLPFAGTDRVGSYSH